MFFLICGELYISVSSHTGSGRNQFSDDDILFQADKAINLSIDCRFRKDFRCLLEGCRRHEGIRGKRRLRDTEHCTLPFRRCLTFFDESFIFIFEIQTIHSRSRDKTGISRFIDTLFLHHLSNNHLNVLVVNFYTLQTINPLHFRNHIVLNCLHSLNLQEVMRVNGTFCQNISGFQYLSVRYLESRTVRNKVGLRLCGFIVRHDDFPLLLCIANLYNSGNFCQNRKSLRLSCFKKFLYTGKTLCDISTCHTAGMEGSHRKLCTRLSDRLCGNGSDRFSHFYRLSGGEVRTVALCTDSGLRTAGENRTNLHGLSAHLAQRVHNERCPFRRNHVVRFNHYRSGFRIDDIFRKETSRDSFL